MELVLHSLKGYNPAIVNHPGAMKASPLNSAWLVTLVINCRPPRGEIIAYANVDGRCAEKRFLVVVLATRCGSGNLRFLLRSCLM